MNPSARRLRRILDPNRALSLRLGWAGLILLVALGCALIPQARRQSAVRKAPDKDLFARVDELSRDRFVEEARAECDRIIALNPNDPLAVAKALEWKGILLQAPNGDISQKLDLFDKAERMLAEVRGQDAAREEEQARIDTDRAIAYYCYQDEFDKAQGLLMRVVNDEHLVTSVSGWIGPSGANVWSRPEYTEKATMPTRLWALEILNDVLARRSGDPDVTGTVMADLAQKYPRSPVAGYAFLYWATALQRDEQYREAQGKFDQASAILGKDNRLVQYRQETQDRMRHRMDQEKPGYPGLYKEELGKIAAWDKSDDPLRDFNGAGDEGTRTGLLRDLFLRMGKHAAKPYLLRAYLELASSNSPLAFWKYWEDWDVARIWQCFKDAGQVPILRETAAEFARQNADNARALLVEACFLNPIDFTPASGAPVALLPLFDDALKVAKDNTDRAAILEQKAVRIRDRKPGEAAELFKESLALDHKTDPDEARVAATEMFDALAASGEEAQADECLGKCLEWFPRDAYQIHCLAGSVYQRLGRFAKAEEQYRRTLETLDPPAEFWNIDVRAGLAAVLSKEGKTKEARSAAVEALTWACRLSESRGKLTVCSPSFFAPDFAPLSFEWVALRLRQFVDLSHATLGEVKKLAEEEAPLPPLTSAPVAPPGHLELAFPKAMGITAAVGP